MTVGLLSATLGAWCARRKGLGSIMKRRQRRLGFLPGWRIFTYVILAFNVLMLVWIIGGVASASHASNCGSLSHQTCQAASDVGTAIGAGILVVAWVFGDTILGVLWLVTRPRGRMCPACGTNARRGVTVCSGCGYNFAMAARQGITPQAEN